MGIVCCHDGKMFVYSAEEQIAKETFVFYEKKYYNQFRDEYLAQKQTCMHLKELGKIEFREVTCR